MWLADRLFRSAFAPAAGGAFTASFLEDEHGAAVRAFWVVAGLNYLLDLLPALVLGGLEVGLVGCAFLWLVVCVVCVGCCRGGALRGRVGTGLSAFR